MTPNDLRVHFDLNPSQAAILHRLAETPDRPVPTEWLSKRSSNVVAVHVSKMRRKLPRGVHVYRLWGTGWFIPRESVARMKRIIERAGAEHEGRTTRRGADRLPPRVPAAVSERV